MALKKILLMEDNALSVYLALSTGPYGFCSTVNVRRLFWSASLVLILINIPCFSSINNMPIAALKKIVTSLTSCFSRVSAYPAHQVAQRT